MKRLRHFQLRENAIYFLSTNVYSPLSSVTFARLLKNDFGNLWRVLLCINGVSYIPLKELCTKLCGKQVHMCEKFAHKFFRICLMPLTTILHNAVLIPGHVCTFRFIYSCIKIYRKSSVSCLTWILVKWLLFSPLSSQLSILMGDERILFDWKM